MDLETRYDSGANAYVRTERGTSGCFFAWCRADKKMFSGQTVFDEPDIVHFTVGAKTAEAAIRQLLNELNTDKSLPTPDTQHPTPK